MISLRKNAARGVLFSLFATLVSIPVAYSATTSWLTVTNVPAVNHIPLTTPNSSHLLTLPGYGGTATITLNTINGPGSLDLRNELYYPAGTFNGYPVEGLDPTTQNTFSVSAAADATGAALTLDATFDFSGLTNGYLPAGAIFMVIDIDTSEMLEELRVSLNNVQYTTPWLSLVKQFDADGNSTTFNYSPFTETFGIYAFPPNSLNSDIPTQYFVTTQDIDRIDFFGTASLGPRGYDLAIGLAVPEPATATLAIVACVAMGVVYRRRFV